MRIYADGSALLRYLPGTDHGDDWARWVADREPDLLVTTLSLSELRNAAAARDATARAVAHEVSERLEVVRYFDQAVERASMTTAVLDPFHALHLGVAVAHPAVEAVATYDVRLARVVAIHGLEVVSPGLPGGWWDAA